MPLLTAARDNTRYFAYLQKQLHTTDILDLLVLVKQTMTLEVTHHLRRPSAKRLLKSLNHQDRL